MNVAIIMTTKTNRTTRIDTITIIMCIIGRGLGDTVVIGKVEDDETSVTAVDLLRNAGVSTL